MRKEERVISLNFLNLVFFKKKMFLTQKITFYYSLNFLFYLFIFLKIVIKEQCQNNVKHPYLFFEMFFSCNVKQARSCLRVMSYQHRNINYYSST